MRFTPLEQSSITKPRPKMRSNEPPSIVLPIPRCVGIEHPFILWECGPYYGTIRSTEYPPLGYCQVLGISAIDETARHDWREFQQLKNLLIGEMWEGVEMYPAEHLVKDPSNRFYIYCFPLGTLPDFMPGSRYVLPSKDAIAPQRAFPEEESNES